MARVLVVDDDPTVSDVVSRYLSRNGHTVRVVSDGLIALDVVTDSLPDLIVLDLMLPGMSGLELCQHFRRLGQVPIIMLSALSDETDRVAGLKLGADDYVTKPFSPRELALRVEAVLRRIGSPAVGSGPQHFTDGDLVLDATAHRARLGPSELFLTAREFDLLLFLMRHPRTAFTREQLFEQVWGWSFGDVSTVTVHARRLREKIEVNPSSPQRLITVWGVGYRYEPEAVQCSA